MRGIPAALLAKLNERWQADATASRPELSLIVTQASVNTLLSETIHNGIPSAPGDVSVRFKADASAPDLAYAICIDNGVAKIYTRKLPAEYEESWSYLWTLGPAADVAIEFNGIWQMDGGKTYFHLVTEDTPWIFWMDTSGNLYAQKWQDESTRVPLATGVDGISTCRLWQSTIDPTQDQGLMVAYLKGGAAYYRAYCYESNGNTAWENETAVPNLGTALTSLQVFRTNDYRAGFVAETGGQIVWAISDRVYTGFSFRPEFIGAQIQNAKMWMLNVEMHFFIETESVVATSKNSCFWIVPQDGAGCLTLSATGMRAADNNRTFKLSFNAKLIGAENLLPYLTVTPAGGSAVPVSAVNWKDADNSLTLTCASDIARTSNVTIAIAANPAATFPIYQQQKSAYPGTSTTVAGEVTIHQTVENENITVTLANLKVLLQTVSFHYGYEDENSSHIAASVSNAAVTMSPVGTLPI